MLNTGDSDAASDISSAHGSSMGLDNDESSDGCSKGGSTFYPLTSF